MANSHHLVSEQPPALKKAWLYFFRSAQLRCPVCGISPMFRPISQMRRFSDWFETLPGCPICNYVYNREPGYFMLPLWSFDYGVASIFGIALALILINYFQLPTWQLLLFTLLPTFAVALLLVRHSKAFYVAIDHYFFHHDKPASQ
jgi:uncharacterized protein (DUF983 family)